MSTTPSHIVTIRPDTIGDLILFSSALSQLTKAWPQARHTVLVRRGYESLSALLPEGVSWLTTDVNPFEQGPDEAKAAFERTLADVAALTPDLLLAPTVTRTWLESALASRFPAARRVCLGNAPVDLLFATALKLELGVDASTAFNEVVPTQPDARDWENTHRLVQHLLGANVPPELPSVRISGEADSTAATALATLGLSDRSWIAVFPGGLANVPIKAWPLDRFADAVISVTQRHALTPVLVGHVSDVPQMDALGRLLAARGLPAPQRWVGQDGQLPVLAGVLRRARMYFGHDTGAMHLAAAVGTPTLGIFGGGHWPRFRPVGRQVAAAVQPLPCFGCGWDCHFDEALCVTAMGPQAVIAAADQLLQTGDTPADILVESKDLPESTLAVIASADKRFDLLQADRLERQAKIEELKYETNGKDEEIAALKASAEERKHEMEAIKAELEAECETKDQEIAQLKRETNGKDEEIAAIKRSAEDRKKESDSKDVEIIALKASAEERKAESDSKDEEIVALKKVCNEREETIFILDGNVKRLEKTVKEQEQNLRDREGRITSLENVLASLPADGGTLAQALHDKDVHIRNLEAIIRAKDNELAGQRQSIENFQNGLYNLEAAKLYGRLLAEKEAVLQTLHRACVEREQVIKQLALENMAMGRAHKAWYSVRQHFRLRYLTPFKDWLFHKVVETYWMQIGILRQYDPRPIVWDKIPKGKLPENRLPAIGIVTPSYGQEAFIESTMLSVLNQKYPKLHYVVQDGGSKDSSPRIIERYADRLSHWESVRDKGQADAIRRGFIHLDGKLGPEDIMAWLNSDDLLAPRSLRYVAEYFARHPEVDAIYGHRIIIDGEDREVGRWIMPRHDNATLEWIDYVPQETLFWRKKLWDRVGGIDTSFQFALDWDLIARFQQAGARIVRVPHCLGCFRVHAEQKTSQHIHTIGNEEMIRIRQRFHGERHSDMNAITHFARKARFTGALTARFSRWGISF